MNIRFCTRVVFLVGVVFAMAFLASCASQKPVVTVSPTPTHSMAAPPAAAVAPAPVFTFYISGSGTDKKRSDTYKMDTARMMDVGTARKRKDGTWQPLTAIAYIEPKDYDSLVKILITYNLFTLDQADLVSNCIGVEMYKLSIWRMDSLGKPAAKGVRAEFSDCTLDYNLLLEPQRTGLKRLIEWFDYMRPRYRPNEPEE